MSTENSGERTFSFSPGEVEFIRERARVQYEREMGSLLAERDIEDEFSEEHRTAAAKQIDLAKAILRKTGGQMMMNAFGEDWHCVCGNTEISDGFHPCNAVGEEIEPDEDWLELVVCGRCGEMYTHDGIVYGKAHPEVVAKM